MSGNGEFGVMVTKNDVVSPALPLQEYLLPLSNLDRLLPPIEFCVFFCYDRLRFSGDTTSSFGSIVASLKKALAETLVPYYAFAGEITTNGLGELEILCNNSGVDFSEASADVELRELNLHIMEESMYRLVPDKKRGVLSVQATKLRCGSVIVSCRVDHRVADAYSTNLFLVSWAEAARSTPISVAPSFRRSLLSPRQPLKLDPTMEELYFPPSSASPPTQNPKSDSDEDDKIVSRLLYVEAEKMEEIQRVASSEKSGRVTKLEALSAVLWKLAAKGEERWGGKRETKLGVVVDGRRRLEEGGGREMGSYVGNVLAFPYRGREAGEMVKKPLEWVAREVQRVVKRGAKGEHFMGLIDWVEAHRPHQAITPRLYWEEETPVVMVSSGRRFPVREVDFGWGPPVLGSYYFREWGSNMEYVMPMPSATVDGDWVIYTLLRKRLLHLILHDAPHLFHPLTSQYLTPPPL